MKPCIFFWQMYFLVDTYFTFFLLQDCRCTFEGQKSFYAIDNQPICGDCAGIGDEPQDE